jgi:hypothetical protein
LDGKLACKFARRVSTHAIGHHEEVTSLRPRLTIARWQRDVIVLIIATPHPNIGQRGVLEALVPTQHSLRNSGEPEFMKASLPQTQK